MPVNSGGVGPGISSKSGGSGSGITSLTGDITGTGPGAASSTLVGTSNVNTIVGGLASVTAKAPTASPTFTGVVTLGSGGTATTPPTNATIQTALGNLVLGTAYQNTLSYDVRLTVYLSITVNTSGVVKLGVGTTNTPTQATIITGVTTIGFVPITFKIPAGQFALLSISGTISDSIAGQYLEAA